MDYYYEFYAKFQRLPLSPPFVLLVLISVNEFPVVYKLKIKERSDSFDYSHFNESFLISNLVLY